MTIYFILSHWFLFICSVVVTVAFFYGFHALNVRLDDEVEEEELSQYKANPWEFRVVKKFD